MVRLIADTIDSDSPDGSPKELEAISRPALPELDLSHPFSKPKIDWLRLMVPRFSIDDSGDSLSKILEETIGCPFRALRGQKQSSESDTGIIGIADKGGIRIEFTGKFWAMISEEREGILRVQTTLKNFQTKFRRFPHLTRIDVCRDIVGLNPTEILPLPDSGIWWSFVTDDFNPVNQWGGIHVSGPRRGWKFKIYDKSRELRDNCKDADKYSAVKSKMTGAGVDDQTTISRMELSLSTKATLKSFSVDLYRGDLDPDRVLAHWARRRSIYICPDGKNITVSKKTKQNSWSKCPRFLGLMCQRPARLGVEYAKKETTDESGKNVDAEASVTASIIKSIPPLNFHDPLYNLPARVHGVVTAAIIRLSPLHKLLFDVQTTWADGLKDRAKTLADKIRSASYIAPIQDIKSDILPRELLFEGLSQLHCSLWMAGHFRLANKLCDHLKNLYVIPDCKITYKRTTDEILRCLSIIVDSAEFLATYEIANNSRPLMTGTVCDGYTNHRHGPSSPQSGDSGPDTIEEGTL